MKLFSSTLSRRATSSSSGGPALGEVKKLRWSEKAMGKTSLFHVMPLQKEMSLRNPHKMGFRSYVLASYASNLNV